MKTKLLKKIPTGLSVLVLLAGIGLFPQNANAQIRLEINVPLPTVTFEVEPALVVVAPGIRVVPGHDHEVFFVGGWYWTRHHKHWYRSRSHRAKWKKVRVGAVPSGLRKSPPGKYRRYKHPSKAHGNKKVRGHDQGKAHKHKHKHKPAKHKSQGHKRKHDKRR